MLSHFFSYLERQITGEKKKMKPSHKYTNFFIFTLFFFSQYVFVSQAQDSCNSALSLQTTTPLPFAQTSLSCVVVWAEHDYILRYGRGDGANVWNFILSAPNTNVYVGMGFSPNGNMVGSRAVVGWVARDGTLAIRKYFLGGQDVNRVRVEPSEQGLHVANSSIILQSNRIYMVFQVISDTPTTHLIYALGPTRFVPAGDQLAEHQDMIDTVLNYATGQFQTQGSTGAALRRSHGLLNMFGWCFFLTIGAMVARYMRHLDPIWFYSHALIQLVGFILGLSGIICGFVLEKRISASVSAHKGIGIFILALGCLQLMAFLLRPDKEAKVRKYWNWYHWGVGRLLILFSVINVSYGIHLADAGTSWNIGFAIALIVLFLIAVVLELKLFRRK